MNENIKKRRKYKNKKSKTIFKLQEMLSEFTCYIHKVCCWVGAVDMDLLMWIFFFMFTFYNNKKKTDKIVWVKLGKMCF